MKSKHISGSSTATTIGWRETAAELGGRDLASEAKKTCPSRGFLCLFCQVRPLSQGTEKHGNSLLASTWECVCGCVCWFNPLLPFWQRWLPKWMSGAPGQRSTEPPPQAVPSSDCARRGWLRVCSYVLASPYKSWMSLLLEYQTLLINKYYKALCLIHILQQQFPQISLFILQNNTSSKGETANIS